MKKVLYVLGGLAVVFVGFKLYKRHQNDAANPATPQGNAPQAIPSNAQTLASTGAVPAKVISIKTPYGSF